MRRRAFIAFSVPAAAWPLGSRAQSAAPIVGVLVAGIPDPTLFLKEFREGLRGLGYVEGKNIVLEIRSPGSTDPARLKASAAELVRLKVKVIVCYQTPTAEAAKETTQDIPIAMETGDPVGTGLVASLAHPGGNLTGMSGATADVAAKNVEILRELLPAAKRIGAMCNANDPFSKPFLAKIQAAGNALGVEIHPAFAHGAAELEAAFAGLLRVPVDAIVVQPSLGAKAPADLALKYRLPAASPHIPFANAGGLLSYSANQPALYRTVAVFVDKMLKGAKPADLPVQEPTTFDLVINLKTAKVLGLSVPPALLARADRVIE
ncbi:ABC transporter substrate-binding protein [Reyranella sp.]|jgi:putative ABC transport system substrate-binding protein|uniref:ABC transporter substrate-binding protein n=1 Tax=Reyranella sp. TaxID=1929291 RepID=UPI002F926389